jgi:hypothetical protein
MLTWSDGAALLAVFLWGMNYANLVTAGFALSP